MFDRISQGLWWDKAWSLVSGCTPVSPACANCWAAKQTHMWAKNPNPIISDRNSDLTSAEGQFNGQIRLNHEFLDKPLRTRKPTAWAVWNDLFHEDVPDDFIDRAFAVMLATHIWGNIPNHRFLILTKRPERMAEYFSPGAEVLLKRWAETGDGWLRPYDPDEIFSDHVYSKVCHDWDENGRNSSGNPYKPWGYLNQLWPLPNALLGVTAENQQTADERIPILLQIPAAVRFISVEPMLGPVDLIRAMDVAIEVDGEIETPAVGPMNNWLNWVICGGESGPNARPMHPDWVRGLRDQCKEARVPFFFKQWGEWGNEPYRRGMEIYPSVTMDKEILFRCGKKKAGRLLDGVEYLELPG